MKKVIFALAAVVALAACSNEEVLVEQPREAIGFDNAFIENAVRSIDPSITTDSLTTFKVYGTTQGNETGAPVVNIYNGVDVVKGAPNGIGNGWKYDSQFVQYWINGNTYKFAAVVNGAVTPDAYGMPAEISYTASANDDTDILYAFNNLGVYTKVGDTNPEVEFTFSHLLSKVKFTVNNTMTNNTATRLYQYTVENVTIEGALNKGVYTVSSKVWAPAADNSANTVAFGNVSNATTADPATAAVKIGQVGAADSATSHYERILIPGTFTATVKATIKTLLNNQEVDVTSYEKEVDLTLVGGHAYNMVLNLGNPGDEIKFTCTEVNGWDTDHNDDGNGNDVTQLQ